MLHIKTLYHNLLESIDEAYVEHINQQQRIQTLENELAQFKQTELQNLQLASELSNLFDELNATVFKRKSVSLTRALSYVRMNDRNKVWLDIKDYNVSEIYGLVYKNYVAGIVVPNNDKPMGLLIHDPKSSYSVYIGKNNAPGIAHGTNSGNLVINYIPAWIKIKPGDEVITSGNDSTFFEGLKVGKVISISESQGFQSAIVSPYYNQAKVNYFHLVK